MTLYHLLLLPKNSNSLSQTFFVCLCSPGGTHCVDQARLCLPTAGNHSLYYRSQPYMRLERLLETSGHKGVSSVATAGSSGTDVYSRRLLSVSRFH